MIPRDSEFESILNSSEPLTFIIRGHQAIESALNSAISEALPDPHAIEVERLSFAMKADLAVALHVVHSDSRPSLIQVNGVRNRFAHRADALFDSKAAADLVNVLSPRQKEAIGSLPSFTDAHEILRLVITALFVEVNARLSSLRDQKLTAIVLHEIVQDRVKKYHENKEFRLKLDEEIRARVEVKKKELNRIDDLSLPKS